MNPAQHGEVFVLKDGSEVDLDLGNYERFLDIELTASHNITTGKVYRTVIDKERRGDFLGETVQIIPHITDQIKACIQQAAEEVFPDGTKADVCLVEVGGTVGDIESMPFLEAVRQMRGDLPAHDYVLIHVTLIPEDAMGDLKTKPTQHSVKALRELGLHADIIVGRSERVIGANTKRKISAFCDLPIHAVISAATARDTYEVPMEMEKEGIADVLSSHLGLENKETDPSWYRLVTKKVHEPGNGSDREQVRHRGRLYQHQGGAQARRPGALDRGEDRVAGRGAVRAQPDSRTTMASSSQEGSGSGASRARSTR